MNYKILRILSLVLCDNVCISQVGRTLGVHTRATYRKNYHHSSSTIKGNMVFRFPVKFEIPKHVYVNGRAVSYTHLTLPTILRV